MYNTLRGEMPVNGMNARGERYVASVGFETTRRGPLAVREENRFSSRGRKRCKQVEEQKSTMYVWPACAHTRAPVHRRTPRRTRAWHAKSLPAHRNSRINDYRAAEANGARGPWPKFFRSKGAKCRKCSAR